jgi:serine/threonine protein kinase
VLALLHVCFPLQREIRVLKRLNHPCVIRLFEVLEAGQKLLLVMEYAPSGSLLDYVRGRKRLGEAEAAYFLQQILTGLQYCHDNEVSWGAGTSVAIQPMLQVATAVSFLLRSLLLCT